MLNSNIKILLGITDTSKDELLALLYEQCEAQFLDYTHQESTEGREHIITRMVVESYNQLGSEGISAHSFSGVTETPIDGYSSILRGMLKNSRKLRLI